MTEEQSVAVSAKTYSDDVSPDSLMSDFRGRPIIAILAFTVIAHVIVVGGFSIGYMKNAVFGEDTSAMSEKERIDMAVRDASTSLREIAERYGISPQELSDRFANGETQVNSASTVNATSTENTATSTQQANSNTPTDAAGAATSETQEPISAIETELQIEAAGPDLPNLPSLEEEDLFK